MMVWLAQATRPQWLEGSVTIPFEIVGLVVGLVIGAGLLYFASRALQSTPETQAERERRSRERLKEERDEASRADVKSR